MRKRRKLRASRSTRCATRCGATTCSWSPGRLCVATAKAAGVDGETVADVESLGVDRWLGALAGDLKEGTYRPRPVRQVLIPKKQRGKFRPLGIPCLRDRVEQTAAMLVLSPIFEADLQPEQYVSAGPTRARGQALHRLLNTGPRRWLTPTCQTTSAKSRTPTCCGIARRVSDGRLLGWVKAWLFMAVEEDDGHGGRRLTNRARRERKGTPQGSPISPLFSNIYMRRFILGWKVLGYARRFEAEIVRLRGRVTVLGKAISGGSNASAVEGLSYSSEVAHQRRADPLAACRRSR